MRTDLWSQGNSLCVAGEIKENENTGLDFPISTENWFNLSTIEHVIHIIFCILSVWLLFVVVAVIVSVYLSFFQCISFPFNPQLFFRCSISFFFGLLYSWFCYLYFWNPCYSLTLSKTVNTLAEKPLSRVVKFGPLSHESGEKKSTVSKMFRLVWTWPLGPVYKEGGQPWC